ncbi:MAG: hypothetical protein J6Q54_08580 [Oscillospiraceae bacterium]|nr:hypothetical protein [Oscillospiraceae bacterium]
MTINAAIEMVDALQPNAFSRQEKICWLSRAEGVILHHLPETREGKPAFSGYTTDTDPDTELLVPEPYAEIYLRYLQAQMDSANGELVRYGNAAALFNQLLSGYRNYFNRTHTPVGRELNYF